MDSINKKPLLDANGFSIKKIAIGKVDVKKNISIDRVLEILGKIEKSFNDMLDWHIAAFQEHDRKKQRLYYIVYESKRRAYYELMEELLS